MQSSYRWLGLEAARLALNFRFVEFNPATVCVYERIQDGAVEVFAGGQTITTLPGSLKWETPDRARKLITDVLFRQYLPYGY